MVIEVNHILLAYFTPKAAKKAHSMWRYQLLAPSVGGGAAEGSEAATCSLPRSREAHPGGQPRGESCQGGRDVSLHRYHGLW